MKSTERLLATLASAVICISSASGVAAATYDYSWMSGDTRVEGSFTTDATAGAVTETNVSAMDLHYYDNDVLQYSIDLVNSELTLPGQAAFAVDQVDFEFFYVIGAASFDLTNPSNQGNPLWPIYLVFSHGGDAVGFGYETFGTHSYQVFHYGGVGRTIVENVINDVVVSQAAAVQVSSPGLALLLISGAISLGAMRQYTFA